MRPLRYGLLALLALSLILLLFSLVPPPRFVEQDVTVEDNLTLRFDYPTHIRLGTSDSLDLSIRAGAGIAPKSQTVFHLDSTCLRLDPPGDLAQPLSPDSAQQWRWTLTPTGTTGPCPLTLVLRLRPPGAEAERLVFVRTLTIETATLLGVSVPVARTTALAAGIIAATLLAALHFRKSAP